MNNRLLQRVLNAALLVAMVALAFAFGLQKIRAFDYWWQLRAGAWMVEMGKVPFVDPFTYTVAGNPWLDIHWLFQLGLYGVYSLGGHDAVVFAKVGMILLLLAALAPIGFRRERAFVTILALAFVLVVAGDRFMPRPELPSFVLLAGVIALLERHERRGDAWVFAVVPMQLLWVNVHGLFALGVAVCAMYAASELLRPLLQPDAPMRRDRLVRLGAVTLLAALMALANPNGLDGALYPFEQLGMIGPPEERGLFGSMIAELVPPLSGGELTQPGLLIAVAAMAALSFGAMLLNWRHLCGAHLLMWLAFAYLALTARRNLALAAIVYAPILVVNLNQVLDRIRPRERLRVAGNLVALAVTVLLTFDTASGRLFERIGTIREPGLGVSEIFYPAGAVEWIARERPPGPVAHHMADGGYVIWNLYPHYQAMSDGRLEVYGTERFAELTISGPERFRQLDEEFHFGVVLMHYSLIPSNRLLHWLHASYNWRLVHLDDTAALFVRVPPSGLSHYREIDVDDPDLFPELGEERDAYDRVRRVARAQWYVAMNRPQLALEVWEGLLEAYPDVAKGDLMHASLLMKTGKRAAAETLLRQLLDERPDDPTVLAQIGDIRMETGDLEAAKALYDRALAVDPHDVYAVLKRGMVSESEGDRAQAVLFYAQVVAHTTPLDPRRIEAFRRMTALAKR